MNKDVGGYSYKILPSAIVSKAPGRPDFAVPLLSVGVSLVTERDEIIKRRKQLHNGTVYRLLNKHNRSRTVSSPASSVYKPFLLLACFLINDGRQHRRRVRFEAVATDIRSTSVPKVAEENVLVVL